MLCLLVKEWFLFIILINNFSTNSFGQVAIPISILNPNITKDLKLGIGKFKAGSDRLFILSFEGVWILSNDGKQITSKVKIENQGELRSIDAIGNQAFIVTEAGSLWTVNKDGQQVNEIKISTDNRIRSIQAVNELLFTATDKGLYIVNQDGKQVNKVTGFDNYSFLLVPSIEKIDDRIFIATSDGLWLTNKEGDSRKIDYKEYLEAKKNTDKCIFIPLKEGLGFIGSDSNIEKIKGVEGTVESIREFGKSKLIGTLKGWWIVNNDCKQVTQIESIEGIVRNITIFEDKLYVGTDEGIWIVNEAGKQVNKIEGIKGYAEAIETVGEYVYLDTFEGIYRLDPKVTIKSKLSPTGLWATIIGYILPPNWLPSEKVQVKASYSNENDKDPYDETIPKEFRFAKSNGDSMPTDDKFSTAEQFSYEIVLGNNDVHYWIKDKWGNTFEQKTVSRGVPSQYTIGFSPFIISVLVVLSIFALSPKIDFCHSAIMNPWLRKYFSIGSVPLLLSIFPFLRRYILKRFSKSIFEDREFSVWYEGRYIYPDRDFLPNIFGEKLEKERKLLLIGQSGIGKTAYFKHLTASYASPLKPSLPKKVIPVYITLRNYGSNSVEELIYNQLFSHGKVTDEELAKMFLEQGGFLIFLDGINEINNYQNRQSLNEFVEKFWTSNYICLSSQQTYPELDGIPLLELKRLNHSKVNELIRQNINNSIKAEEIISKLTDDDYELYSIPRDLEFAIEILNSSKDILPKTRTELYKTVFSFIFSKWEKEEKSDAGANLYRNAYIMMTEHNFVFDSVEDSKYKDITIELFDQKLLIKKEKNYYFRHDLILSYLASEYFYLRWENLFENLEGNTIDNNWLEMLKFSCENIQDVNEVENLVYKVLEKSIRKDLVEDLFKWIKNNHPDKCEPWENNFYIKYGKLSLN